MKKLLFILIFLPLLLVGQEFVEASGVSLYLSPASGSFLVGSTFTLSIYINTKESQINVVEVDLKFPADIIQVASPTTGQSFISEWLVPPSYSNTNGTLSFKGGIPRGVKVSAGLISTINFRAKAPGLFKIEFLDSSKIFLNDSQGTEIIPLTKAGVYQILVPPSQGSEIVSFSHFDPDIWYQDNNPIFSWEKDLTVTDFSFSFSQNAQEKPDKISEGSDNFKSYTGVLDGIWYFHLRAKKRGVWGEVSHKIVRIDKTPPNAFVPEIKTSSSFIYFQTKDSHSGIDYYEVSVRDNNKAFIEQPFFTESISPFKIPYQKSGKYDVIVRVYDKAGNKQEGETSFRLITPFISLIQGKGIQFKGLLIPWFIFYFVLFIFIGVMIYFVYYFASKRKFGFQKGIKEIGEALSEIKKIEQKEEDMKELKEKFKTEKQKLEQKLNTKNRK